MKMGAWNVRGKDWRFALGGLPVRRPAVPVPPCASDEPSKPDHFTTEGGTSRVFSHSGFVSRLVLVLFLMAGSAMAREADPFLKGNEAYAAGDFAAAKREYSAAAAARPDENAWFNLGNACFRLGDLGHAALAYERALVLSPNHAEATENLRFLRQKSGARADERPWLERGLGFLPPPFATWLAVLVAWGGFAWGGAALWRRTGAGGVVGGALLVLLGAAYGGGLAWWRSVQAREAIVVVEKAEIKSEPATEAVAQGAGTLNAGTRVRIVSSVGAWIYCELPADAHGWLPAKALERVLAP